MDKRYDDTKETARVVIPWEMPEGTIRMGEEVLTTGMEGEVIGKARVIGKKKSKWQNRRVLVSIEVPFKNANNVAGIRIKEPPIKKNVTSVKTAVNDDVIICRCERITKKEIVDYIKKTGTKDINAVKAALRIGMGPCGGKTCTELVMRIFRELGIDLKDVEPPVDRPFTQEVSLKTFLKGDDIK